MAIDVFVVDLQIVSYVKLHINYHLKENNHPRTNQNTNEINLIKCFYFS